MTNIYYYYKLGHPILEHDGKIINIYDESKKRRFSYMNHLVDISKYPIKNKSLQERFVYKNQTTWHLFDYLLLWSSSQVHPKNPGLDYLLTHIEILIPLITNKTIFHCDQNSALAVALVKRIAKKKKVSVTIVKDVTSPKIKHVMAEQSVPSNIALRALARMRHLLKITRKLTKKKSHLNMGSDVLLLANLRFDSGNPEHHQIFSNIYQLLKEKEKNVCMLSFIPPNQVTNLGVLLRRSLYAENFISDYTSTKTLFLTRKLHQKFKAQWREVRDDKQFHKQFTYQGINYYDLFTYRLDYVFEHLCFGICEGLLLCAQAIEKIKPKILVLDHENSFYGKCCMIVAKGVQKTIALQYELVYPGCVHTYPDDIAALKKNTPLWRPLPDLKCVWGPYATKILTSQCNYSPKIIAQTGNPKFDFFLKRKYDNHLIEKEFCLESKKRVLIAPAPAIMNILTQVAKKLPHIDFIIKPKFGVSIAAYEEVANQAKNIHLLPSDSDLYALIKACDVVFITNSTVGIEAMLLETPVLLMREGHEEPKGLPYWQAALCAWTADDVILQLKSLLNSSKIQTQVKQKMNDFIKIHHNPNDGLAAQRIVTLIETLEE